MSRNMTISELRRVLGALPDTLKNREKAIAITRRGECVLAVMSWEMYEGMLETMEILKDRKLMSDIRKGIEDIKSGRTIPLEQIKKELRL